MNDVALVGLAERVCQLNQQPQRFVGSHSMRPDIAEQLALQVFHHQVRRERVVVIEVEDVHHRLERELVGKACFEGHAPPDRRIGHLLPVRQLHRDVEPGRQVLGEVHHARLSAPQLSHQPVVAQ